MRASTTRITVNATSKRAVVCCSVALVVSCLFACTTGGGAADLVAQGNALDGGPRSAEGTGTKNAEPDDKDDVARGTDGGDDTKRDCTECPKGCFDLDTDVSNCGSCGLKCSTPAGANTLPTCTKGKCGEG